MAKTEKKTIEVLLVSAELTYAWNRRKSRR